MVLLEFTIECQNVVSGSFVGRPLKPQVSDLSEPREYSLFHIAPSSLVFFATPEVAFELLPLTKIKHEDDGNEKENESKPNAPVRQDVHPKRRGPATIADCAAPRPK